MTVTGLDNGVTAVAGGQYHSLAIQNGAVRAWGYGYLGELGNGANTPSNVPVDVTGLDSGVTAIAMGEFHSLAIQNGAVFAWGWNHYGTLGNGTNIDSNVPVAVSGLGSGVIDIATGYDHSLAIQDGNIYVWGRNHVGQLGDGTYTNRSVPKLVLDLSDEFIDVASADYSNYALSSDGSLWVWGDNHLGQLGLGNTISFNTPQHLLPPAGYRFTSINAHMNGAHVVATIEIVPEPASLSFLCIGGSFAVLRRKRISRY